MSPSDSPATFIYFSCGHCGTKLRVPAELAGETGPCPRCGLVITAPLVSSVPGVVPGPSPVGSVSRTRPAEDVGPIPGPVYEPPLTLMAGQWERRSPILRPSAAPAPAAVEEIRPEEVSRPGAESVLPDHGRHAGGVGGWAGSEDVDGADSQTLAWLGGDKRTAPKRSGGAGFAWAMVGMALAAGGGVASWKAGLWDPGALVAGLERPVTAPGELHTGTTGGGAVVKAPGVNPVASLAVVDVPEAAAEETVPVVVPEPVPPKAPAPNPMISDPTFFTGGADEAEVRPEGPMGPPIQREEAVGEEESKVQARAAVRRFLEAPSWRERVDTVWTRGDAAEVLKAYYAEKPDLSVQHYRLDFFHREELADGGTASIFFLTYSGESDGFPILVRSRGADHRLDWDLFVEFRERTFQRFVEERPEIPGRFRLVMQRVTYLEADREEIPDSESWLCYRLDPPYPGWTRHAFVAKDSPDGAALAGEGPFDPEPLAAEVELGWETFRNGKRYLAIRRLVAKGWSGPVATGL